MVMIDELLEKYYTGETSRREDLLLAELLRGNPDPRYDADRRLVCPLHRPMPDFGKMARKASRRRFEFKPMRWGVVAASVCALIVAAGYIFREPALPSVEPDMTVAEATEQTRLALMMISDAFERGFQELDNLNDL